MDLMQSNAGSQYIYISPESKSKLPFYLQSFANNKENDFYKLSVTAWAMHETKTRQVLGANYLMQLSTQLNKLYGADALTALPAQEKSNTLAVK